MSAAQTRGCATVSIIMPTYNSARFIDEAITSVLSQSFEDWELLVVDDCSDDATLDIATGYAGDDNRIIVLEQDRNGGPAKARNRGLAEASARYIAYLDSDDAWLPGKLERQLAYMRELNAGMCFTAYETVNENGSHRNIVHVPRTIDYKGFLKKPVTCTHTVMFDTMLVDKSLLVMPDLKKRQDGATWLRVLRTGVLGYGLDEVLAKNRKRRGSVSANKLSSVRYTWHLYHDIERLSVPYASYCLFWQLVHAVQKRIGRLG